MFQEKSDTWEFQAVIQDITQRKQSEEALRASEEKYRSLIDHIPDVVWTAYSSGDLVYISGNAITVLGFSAEELRAPSGQFWMDRIHLEDVARVKRALSETFFPSREVFDVEYRFLRKDGEWIWVQNCAFATRRVHEGDPLR